MTTHIVVALACEARPIVAERRLVRDASAAAFPVFRSADEALVVTGVGSAAAAGGVGYLAARTDAARHDAWINVGIAGHRDKPVGSAWVAHGVEDAATGWRSFPPRSLVESMASAAVRTMPRVERSYPDDVLYEMEAAAFVATARRFATAERVQILKVVSDGPRAEVDALDADVIADLMAGALPRVEELARCLAARGPGSGDSGCQVGALREALAGWRFSATQRRQLAELERRVAVLLPGQGGAACIDDVVAGIPRSAPPRDVIGRLDRWLASLPVRLDGGSRP